MQNRYAGDIGDFGKFALLRQIAGAGTIIGLNWYLVPDEKQNNDGKHIAYLTNPRYEGYDDTLRASLLSVVNSQRSVSSLEAQDLIPDAIYYKEVLHAPNMLFSRPKWHMNAMEALKRSDVVFLDPDNGLLVKSVSSRSAKSNKYVLRSEIADYYAAGKSVIFYNHRSREKEPAYLQRFEWIKEDPILHAASLAGLKFTRGTIRDYLFLIQPGHAEDINNCIEKMLFAPWCDFFSELGFHR